MSRKIITRSLALAGTAGLALAAAAVPAFASGPGGPVQAAVVVPSTLTFTFTSATSFSLAPGVTSPAAVAFTVSDNDAGGYTVMQSAPNLAGPGGATLLAGDLTDILHFSLAGQTPGVNPPVALTNAPVQVAKSTVATAGDTYAQDWLATIPAGTPGGTYTTTITYVAAANQ